MAKNDAQYFYQKLDGYQLHAGIELFMQLSFIYFPSYQEYLWFS